MRFLIFVLVIVMSVSVVSTIVYAKDHSEEDINYIQVKVTSGDTLWSIAKPYYDGDSDFRELIYTIKKLNHLEQATIYPGQVIKIPIAS